MSIRTGCVGAVCVAAVFASLHTARAEQITLSQALEAAMRGPVAAAAEHTARAEMHAAHGARALSNPELTVAPSLLGEAGADSAVYFSQPLEVNGIRRARGSAAASAATAAEFEARAVRQAVALQVKRVYWQAAWASEQVRLSEENLRYVEALRTAVQKQLDVGAAPGSQLIKTDVELAKARQELALANLGLATARAELNTLMGRPKSSDVTPSDPLRFDELPLDEAQLHPLAQVSRPEIAAAQAALDAAKAEAQLARLQRRPDVAVQARRETFRSDTDGGVALAVTLPVLDWGSNKAERQRAESIVRSREKLLEAARNDVALDVDLAVGQLRISSEIIREYQAGILEKSEQLAGMARKGYEQGATGYLEVLEAQRTLRGVMTDYTAALADHARAVAQLEWAVGADLLEEATR